MFSKVIGQMVALALLLFAIISIVAADSDVAKLCNGDLIGISRISHAKALVEASKSTSERSCEQYKRSLAALEPILEQVESGDVCQVEFIEKVGNYHNEFIRSKSFLIPEALRNFFVSLVFEISAKCKTTLLNSLKADSANRISEEDYSSIPLEQSAERGGDQLEVEDVLLAEDVQKLLAGKRIGKFVMLVNVEVGAKFRKMTSACETKFRPFYLQLIVPIVKLSKLGYFSRENNEDEQLLLDWFKIVQTCEALTVADVFEDTEKIIGDKNSLTFVSADKTKELRKNQISLNEAVLREEQPIEYTPSSINLSLADQVPEIDLNELEKRIAKAGKTPGIKSMLKKKMKAKLKKAFLSGKLRFKSLNSLKCSKRGKCEAEVTDVSEVALNEDDTRVERRKRAADPAVALLCLVVFPCAMLAIALLVLFLVGSGIYLIGEGIYKGVKKIRGHKKYDDSHDVFG